MSDLAAIGIDAGSTTTKVAGVSTDGALLAWKLEAADPRTESQVNRLVAELREDAGGADVASVATGYGRKLVTGATRRITEITCHALGVFSALGGGGTLVDIGGQDSKVIRVDEQGRASDFSMNDKCAAGTGRFLEHTAARLGVPLDELGATALSTTDEERISSTCTVFAESEIISLIARGVKLESIVRGLHRSMIGRVATMIRHVGVQPPLMLSGGVARNPAVRAMLEEDLGEPVTVPEHAQLMGAYGAALAALRSQD